MMAKCEWPNGESREVQVGEKHGDEIMIFWNETVNSDQKAIVGFQESVPYNWLVFDGE